MLAALHAVETEAVGLGDLGCFKGYFGREIARWSKQYGATETDTIITMNNLMDWRPANLPDDDAASIVHGDFRSGNAIVSDEASEVIAQSDRELSTLGHPLADLGYVCALNHVGTQPTGKFKGLDCKALGIPTEQELLDFYCM